ncbi:Holliday junction resolvase RuvX [Fimbriimonas ginsengisoli]|uniref:Putative pre-16S rRNA nuclease n=1 Tax=Fimbriimonas ginsengisoli Gsoil 348 TaxID=661478 RepID=A0A068NLH8_FIMGI|nr:Holliday junction resolvase RuvX [Fimbriimonas ginsengisoli]AIE84423.1 Holliday junction resolvase YqgF [Fimbriimonas ginsengisoli Gsoil 348]
MRFLGVDFGFKRIGLAVMDGEAGLPAPRNPLAASGKLKTDANVIDQQAKREQADAIVVGLPIEPNGEEGRMARICRQLAGHLEELGRPVYLVDERLTSAEAERTLLDSGLKGSERRKRRDAEAACLILERYRDAQKTQ